MTALSMVATVWLKYVQHVHVCSVPRALADDLLVSTRQAPEDMDGEQLFDAHNCAVEDTIEFVSDMSGTLSPDKCCTLANDKVLRARFKAHRLTAATLTQRMLKGCDILAR
eukprot:15470153-Alexandrium_andersonii.AAC.1